MRASLFLLIALTATGCGQTQLPPTPPGALPDGSSSGKDAAADDDAAVGDDAGVEALDGGDDAAVTEDAGGDPDAGDDPDAGSSDAGESEDAGTADAGPEDAGPPTCRRIVPTSQPLDWGDCYTEDWPVYTGGMVHVLATYFSGMSSGAGEWTDASDRDYYVALPMSWVYLGRNQAGYNQTTYSLIGAGFHDPPKTNIPPRPWGQDICVASLDTGRSLVARLIDAGPGDSVRTDLVGVYGAQTWIDLSPGAAAYLATGSQYGTPDNQIVTFWEGPCE